jgi:DNA-directed RNA polymerase subunit RPC12/RpoP
MSEQPEAGVRPCMKCGWLFVSPDPERVRRCQDCKQKQEVFYQPRTLRVLSERPSASDHWDY